MGQAKQRGTAEQRAQQAREKRREGLQPVDIDELRAAHNVPADAEFVGFVVWLRERDEFLVHVEDTPALTKRAYGPVVDAAVRFPTWDDAAPHAEASKHSAVVAAAFDIGKQIFIIGGQEKENMSDNKPKFFTFDEAVEVARSEPGAELVGLKFVEPFTHLKAYIINTDSDDPDSVSVFYEGGALFDSMGEEDFFDLDDVPAEAKKLFYARQTDLGQGNVQVMGMTSEFVLKEILPGLHDDAKYRDHAHFMQVAGAEFCAYWGR